MAELVEKQKLDLLEKTKISLWIDSYNGIFSDFDPREFNKRELSTDFIAEAKRFTRSNLKGKLELDIVMPKEKRNEAAEVIIKKRLKEYFAEQLKHLIHKKKRILKQGIGFLISGIIIMLLTTFILITTDTSNFILVFLGVLGEPAGWFLFWEGLNLVIFDSKEKNSDLEFNQGMSKINIAFGSVE